jgi:hypothetical protein
VLGVLGVLSVLGVLGVPRVPVPGGPSVLPVPGAGKADVDDDGSSSVLVVRRNESVRECSNLRRTAAPSDLGAGTGSWDVVVASGPWGT